MYRNNKFKISGIILDEEFMDFIPYQIVRAILCKSSGNMKH